MFRNMRLGALGIIAALAVSLAVGAAAYASSNNRAHAASSKPVKIAYLAIGTENDFIDATINEVKTEAKKVGATVTVFNGNFDAATQLAQCQTVASSGNEYQAVVLYAVAGQALKPCGALLKNAKIPLVTIGQPLTDSLSKLTPLFPGVTANIGQPIDIGAAHMVQALVSACAPLKTCNIVWFRTTTSVPAQDAACNAALQVALKKHKNMHIVAQAVLSPPDQAGIGVPAALAKLGMKAGSTGNDVRIIGQGGGSIEVGDVRKGSFYAAVLVLPASEAHTAVKIAAEAARGQAHPDAVDPEDASSVPNIFTHADALKFPKFKGEWTE
jgi:ABC-type sugar transport system substrate-binding protein